MSKIFCVNSRRKVTFVYFKETASGSLKNLYVQVIKVNIYRHLCEVMTCNASLGRQAENLREQCPRRALGNNVSGSPTTGFHTCDNTLTIIP